MILHVIVCVRNRSVDLEWNRLGISFKRYEGSSGWASGKPWWV